MFEEAYAEMMTESARKFVAEKKICNRCEIRYTLEEFKQLPLVGFVGDPEIRTELRNCHCGSTLAINHIDGGVVLNG
jgi:hypothetical protein